MKWALEGNRSSASRGLELVPSLEACELEPLRANKASPEGAMAAMYAQSLRWACSAW